MMRRDLRGQRGFALIVVMLIGAAAMYGVTSLLGESTVVERRAQDEQLLKLRAYWAMQGHISYAVSRMTQGPPCGNTCKNAVGREDAFDGFFDELDEGGPHRVWRYPEISASYEFPVAAFADFSAPHVIANASYPAFASAHPLIDALWPVRRNTSYLICSGVEAPSDPCPSSFNGLDKESGITFVSRIEPN